MIQNRLTKVIEKDGEEFVVCALYGTDKCLAGDSNGCSGCQVLALMFNTLHFYENLIDETGGEVVDAV